MGVEEVDQKRERIDEAAGLLDAVDAAAVAAAAHLLAALLQFCGDSDVLTRLALPNRRSLISHAIPSSLSTCSPSI